MVGVAKTIEGFGVWLKGMPAACISDSDGFLPKVRFSKLSKQEFFNFLQNRDRLFPLTMKASMQRRGSTQLIQPAARAGARNALWISV
jgi:hypothetical protein